MGAPHQPWAGPRKDAQKTLPSWFCTFTTLAACNAGPSEAWLLTAGCTSWPADGFSLPAECCYRYEKLNSWSTFKSQERLPNILNFLHLLKKIQMIGPLGACALPSSNSTLCSHCHYSSGPCAGVFGPCLCGRTWPLTEEDGLVGKSAGTGLCTS